MKNLQTVLLSITLFASLAVAVSSLQQVIRMEQRLEDQQEAIIELIHQVEKLKERSAR